MANGNDKFDINKLAAADLPFYIDGTDALANTKKQIITFYHVNSDHFVAFKAFITAYNETYNSDWASEKVYGRADPIYMFKNTTRKITLAFKVPAATVDEAYQNLAKVQKLLQYLYPNYTGLHPRAYNPATKTFEESRDSAGNPLAAHANTISGAPLVRLGVMNLARRRDAADVDKFVGVNEVMKKILKPSEWGDMKKVQSAQNKAKAIIKSMGSIEDSTADATSGLLGVIENVNINHNIEGDDGVFEGNAGGAILPKMIEVNVDFSPIHEQHLGWFDDGTFGNMAFPYGAVDDMTYYEPPKSKVDPTNKQAAGSTNKSPDAAEEMPTGTKDATKLNQTLHGENQTSEQTQALLEAEIEADVITTGNNSPEMSSGQTEDSVFYQNEQKQYQEDLDDLDKKDWRIFAFRR